ncbi:MAG: NADH-quinone oxidoreductase subunit B [Armatimonadetes bacterium]|nr:NADH-quinone oxidoreductase subunit B [Armatimonadota bacterium]
MEENVLLAQTSTVFDWAQSQKDKLKGVVDNVVAADHLIGRTVRDVERWAQRNAVWPALFGLACCAIEMMAVGGSHFDLSRFGSEVFRASPRQADLMIVAGRVSHKMAPVLKQIYDQMAEPKWVLAMGACASSGGVFNNYAIVQGVDNVVPVDIYVPGCPPRPELLLEGIFLLQEKIGRGEPSRAIQLAQAAAAGAAGATADVTA